MSTLNRQLRQLLERTVLSARKGAEKGAEQTLESLAVAHAKPWASMTREQQALRNRLRARARQLGDRRNLNAGTQEIERLVQECAYEHWHRMLFARYLAENELLIEPTSGVSITLEECQALAREQAVDWIELASSFGVRMLSQVFRAGDPVLDVTFAVETRKKLEGLLETLPREIFVADDSLGWAYQFWQAERKDEVNASGIKIGAEEIGPVTQLFTEDYMVEFLLHNTLGAWWAGKAGPISAVSESDARQRVSLSRMNGLPAITWEYLRFVQDETTGQWHAAAGAYEAWPRACKDIRFLDPCMGSGHFPVFVLPLMARLRMEEENLSHAAAVAATLRDNIFGLEIDPRCTQIGAFSLALSAWKLGGYQLLPPLHLACSGLAPYAAEKDWVALAGADARMRGGMARLYALFSDAPVLGSLINPRAGDGTLFEADYRELAPMLERALGQEVNDDTSHELTVTARGLAKAAEILAGEYTLVATNVPYLGRGKQNETLKEYCARLYPAAKSDLATCFVTRCVQLSANGGTTCLVTPQNWLFLGTYAALRRQLLRECSWSVVARLGPRAFETIGGEVVNVALVAMTSATASETSTFVGIDAAAAESPLNKAHVLASGSVNIVNQAGQLVNPDSRVSLEDSSESVRLASVAISLLGLGTCDAPHYVREFWQQPDLLPHWSYMQTAATNASGAGGRESVVAWDATRQRVHGMSDEERRQGHNQDYRGREAWGKAGVAVSLISTLKASPYSGDLFDKSVAVIVPRNPADLPAITAFVSSQDFSTEVRKLDQKVMVTNSTLIKVPFDLAHWHKRAAETYARGLPQLHSSDPTQWLFNGHPMGSDQPLQVGLGRLLGYRWPRQTGSSFQDCATLDPDGLEDLADDDGVACLAPVRGEAAAAQRLTAVLERAFGKQWSTGKHDELLANVDFADGSLSNWLEDKFSDEHNKLFFHRPFLWHIWDGLKGGFGAIVNYHKLAAPNQKGRKLLEKLSHTYLGDWVARQRAEQKAGAEGADARVAAAVHLKSQLEAIVQGEPPFDLFARWKPLREQAIGWEPDINDGIRVNIRPILAATTLSGKSILRRAPNIGWTKDRGTDPERPRVDFPWFWSWDEHTVNFKGGRAFDGKRWNALHYTRACKLEARGHHDKSTRGK